MPGSGTASGPVVSGARDRDRHIVGHFRLHPLHGPAQGQACRGTDGGVFPTPEERTVALLPEQGAQEDDEGQAGQENAAEGRNGQGIHQVAQLIDQLL